MQFRPFQLEEWLRENEPRAKHVLGVSGMKALTLEELGATVGDVELDYGPMPAMPELSMAIADAYKVPAEEVLVTIGGSEADLLAMLACTEHGDKLVIENPTYPPLQEVPHAFGARTDLLDRLMSKRWRVDIAEFNEEVDRATKLIVLTNLHNPTSTALDRHELQGIHDIASDAGAWVLVDEAFREMAFRDVPLARSLGERFISTNTLTKSYGLAGLRVGWILGPREIVERAKRIKAYLSIANAIIDQRLALAVLRGRERILSRNREIRDKGFAAVKAWIAKEPRVKWVEPDGGNMCFPDLPEGVDDVRFAKALMAKHATLVSPGTFLGMPGYFRLGFARDRQELDAGLKNISAMLSGQ